MKWGARIQVLGLGVACWLPASTCLQAVGPFQSLGESDLADLEVSEREKKSDLNVDSTMGSQC